MPYQTTLGPGAKLRAARKAAGLSQVELAERLGVTKQSVSNHELDKFPISPVKILEICSAIGCDPHSIDSRLSSTRTNR